MKPLEAIQSGHTRDQEKQLFLAGERVQPGLYRNVVTEREYLIEREDALPATCDGQVACYALVHHVMAEGTRAPADGVHTA